MNFLQLIEKLTAHVGQHQLPANLTATGIQSLIDSSALHYDLATRIARAIYDQNRCRRLTDPVEAEATFEALGPIRAMLLCSSRTDVDAFRFMEDLCTAVAKIFDKQRRSASAANIDESGGSRQAAELILFDSVRRRVKSLA